MFKNDVVASSSLFENLSAEHLGILADISEERFFAKGKMLFFEGDPGTGFYVVADGRVKIFKVSPLGKEHILHIFDKGGTIGEVPVFNGKSYPASAEALLDTNAIYFPRDKFIDVLNRSPTIALGMLAVLSKKLLGFTRQIEDLSLKEVPARLAGYLLYLSEEQENKEKIVLDISKGQLASLLGTTPETLSRILAKMVGEELIEVQGRIITLCDLEKLAERQMQ